MKISNTHKIASIQAHSEKADQFAASYEKQHEDPYQSCFTYSRQRLDSYLECLLPERGDGLRLLDVGCGVGHHLARLRSRGYQVAGVDASKEMLRHARVNNPGAEILEADVDDLPFPEASFDIVLCVEVLRHIPRSERCIREMGRVLRRGGLCLATATPVLNLNGYALINRFAHQWKIGNLTRHKQFFHTSGRLRREFRDAGFAKIAIHGVYLGPINWVQRLAPQVLHRFLKAWEPLDRALADRPLLRDLSNMYLVRGVRDEERGG